MKKALLGLVVVAVLVAAMGMTSLVSAKGPGTSGQASGGSGYGRANAGTGSPINLSGTGTGILHDELIASYADALGISVDELNSLITSGETLSQIAYDQGMTYDEFTTLLADARVQALDQAVADGILAQAQADWLAQRGAGISMGGAAGRGMGTGGQGLHLNQDCPYIN